MAGKERRGAKSIFGFNKSSSSSASSPAPIVVSAHEARKTETLCAYMLPSLLALREQKPQLRVLDVGCGPGTITVDLARLVPDGDVLGLDLSAAVLETAKAHAAAHHVANARFQTGDMCGGLPFPDGAFDVVHTHQAVAHVAEPVRAIRELARVTRPAGGLLCLREGDLHTARFYPDAPALDACFRVITAVHARQGGATDAGRRLRAWTVQAGVARERITLTHSATSYNTPEARRDYGGHWPARCMKGAFAESARAMGVSERKLDEFALAWKKWIEDEDGVFAMMHGEVIARM